MTKKIFIFTGLVHTGKTTRLMHWAVSQKKIDGIFQPVIDDKRFIYHIASRTLKSLEVPTTLKDEQTIKIGNYSFSKETFEWAKNILLDCFSKDLEWLVIDEIGLLELDGNGLEPAISNIFDKRKNISAKIVCVVREEILRKFIDHYKLQNCYEIFEPPL
ncbi:MAG: nucleoside-triphosphatase [Melioribacteraceae bacterium]